MATFVAIHGAGDVGSSWDLVAAELGERGQQMVAVDLPCEDDSAGWSEYADSVVNAVGDRPELVVVAHSLGAYVATARVPPAARGPACSRGGNGAVTGRIGQRVVGQHRIRAGKAGGSGDRRERRRDRHLPPRRSPRPGSGGAGEGEGPVSRADERALAARGLARCAEPVPALPRRPHVPAEWIRRLVRERLGITPDEIRGGHCPFLSRPRELADRLETYHRTKET